MTPGTLFVHRYQIEDCLVHTGSRRVYRARDLLNDEPVALKGSLIPPNGDTSAVLAEWRCLRSFSHPALVKALELGHAPLPPDGPEGSTFHYFTVPWIDGPSLVKQAKHLDANGIRQWLKEALELVAWLHHHGLTRLDLKPEHFLWDGKRWRLIDLDQMRSDDPYAAPELFGTRAYMAPEILREGSGGPSADLFSLGAILLEVITGKPPPLKGKTREEILAFLAARVLPPLPSSMHEAAPDLVLLCGKLLALEPADRPLTAEAAQGLLQETSPTSWRKVPPCPAIVGNQTLLSTALDHLTRAEAAGGGGLLLTGPSRAGHSTALESLAVEAQQLGLPVFAILPNDLRAEPLATIHALASWLHRLAGAPEADEGAQAPALAGDISREEVVEGLITRALVKLLEGASLARERLDTLSVLLMDDPGRLDALSQAALRRLVPLLPGSGLWLVMAGQGTLQTAGMETLPLQPLERADVRTLAEAILGPGALTHDAELERLCLQTGGWAPRVLDALLHRWWDPAAGIERAPTSDPSATEHAWSTHLTEVLDAARVLAVMVHPLPEAVVAALLEEHAPDVSVQRLVDVGILKSSPGPAAGTERVQFTDEIGRRWLLHQTPEAEQKQCHLQLAELLVQHLSLGLSGAWQESIAHHFLGSDQPRRALSHLDAAVDESLSAYRLDDAVGLLNAGLNILRPTEMLRPQLLHRRGELELELARFESARASFEQALEQPGLKDPALKARCLAGLGRAHMKLAHYPEAQRVLEQALELKSSIPTHDPVLWLQWLAWLYGNVGDAPSLERMKAVLEQARSSGIASGSRLEVDQIQLEVLLGMRLHAAEAGLIARAEGALEQARVLEYTSGQVRLLNCLLALYAATGQIDHQLKSGEALLTLSRATFNQEQEARVANNLALLLRSQGRLLEAHTLFERSAALAERLKRVELELRFRLELADTLLRAGALVEARKHLRRTAELIEASSKVAEADHLSQQLLESRLELRQRVLASPPETEQTLDRRLAALVTALESVRPAYLQLEALADRMELAILEQQPRRALQVLAPFLDRAETPETALAWERLHLLGTQAHAQRLPSQVQLAANKPASASDTSAKSALPQTPTPTPTRSSRSKSTARAPESSPPSHPEAGLITRVKPPERFGLESPEVWLDRVLRVVQVADGEEQLAARLAELAGALLGGRGLVLFFTGRMSAGKDGASQEEVLELAELRNNPVSSTLVRLVRTTGEPFRSADVRLDERLASAQSIQALSRPSVLCEPIRGGRGELLGVAYVDDLPVGCSDDPAAVRVVEQVAGMAGAMLEAFARRRQREQAQAESLSQFGESPAMQRVAREIELLSRSTRPDLTVFLTGETGTGKTFFARKVHELSTWRERPFYMLNCASIPSELLETELFGSVRGAFNGAVDKAGAFEAAEDGTLFLDEVGELTLAHQAKLLTVLGERQFRRVGETRVRLVKARLICATNRDLRAMVEAGTFRADLLSRISVNSVRLPSLRERGPEDIRLLICHELREQLVQLRKRTRKEPLPHFEDHFTPKAQQYLLQYPWPYNAREVQKLFERETIRERLGAGKKIDEKLLEGALSSGLTTPKPATLPSLATWETVDPKTFFGANLTLRDLKSRSNHLIGGYIQRLVEDCGDDKNKAAGVLKCARDSVYKYLGL